MSLLDNAILSKAPVNKTVVRLKTTVWNDSRGLHIKRSLTYLKRQSTGNNCLQEEIEVIGAIDVARIITNLDECKDGIYEVNVCNIGYDWESGYAESYDLILIPIKE